MEFVTTKGIRSDKKIQLLLRRVRYSDTAAGLLLLIGLDFCYRHRFYPGDSCTNGPWLRYSQRDVCGCGCVLPGLCALFRDSIEAGKANDQP